MPSRTVYSEEDSLDLRFGTLVPVLAGSAALLVIGYFSANLSGFENSINWILPAAVAGHSSAGLSAGDP